jgi:LysR family transcriptional regulator for metE and metH
MEPALEIRHLRLVAAIAEEGGMTRAAERLHLTQSALSHQLRDAEQKLGTALFLRLSRRMVPTPAGEELLASAGRVLDELGRAEARIRSRGAGETGTIRLSTECYTCYHWLPPLLAGFRERHPGIEVRIDLEATRRTVAALLEGKLELALVSSEPKDRRLRLTPLFEDELVVVMSAAHRLARRTHVRPADLEDETVLVYPPKEDSLLLQRALLPAGIRPRAVLEVPLTEAVLEMARAGVGVAFLARWAIARELGAGSLVARPLSRVGSARFRRRWCVATLKAAKAPAYVRDFIGMIVDQGTPLKSAEVTPRRA